MKTLRWAALAALTLASPAAMAGDLGGPSVSVYGAIRIGPGNIAIQQNSTANFAGVLRGGRRRTGLHRASPGQHSQRPARQRQARQSRRERPHGGPQGRAFGSGHNDGSQRRQLRQRDPERRPGDGREAGREAARLHKA